MKKILISLIVLMTVFIIGVVVVYNRSTSSFDQAKEEATAIAENQFDLNTVENFYWYNGNETYFTVTGQTVDDENIIVVIRRNDGQITVVNQEGTISEAEAKSIASQETGSNEILEARIGIDEGTVIWEVSYRNDNDQIGYYIMDLRTGEWIRTIGYS